jgi:hypothetical protein
MKTLMLALAALSAPAVAQAPKWSKPQSITITMTDHGFVPRQIAVRRDGLYVLHVVNRSGKGHNLTQKSFFANAHIQPQDRGLVRDGQIVLNAGERATVRFQAPDTRPGGMYQFSSTVLADAGEDYKGAFLIR